MPLLNLIARPTYHKNGTQWIGKVVCGLIGEKRYEWCRIEKRIFYANFYYWKQIWLTRFQSQYPHLAMWFSLLNKADTSVGIPAKRQYERYQDFAVFNINHEGWFQAYFFMAAIIVAVWNWWVLAGHYDLKGVNLEDEDLYRVKDATVTTCFDRTKYNFNYYFWATHFNAESRRMASDYMHPDDPKLNYKPNFRNKTPYGLDRYVKYYGFSQNMRMI